MDTPDILQQIAQYRPAGMFLALTLVFITAEALYVRLITHDIDAHDMKETAASVGVAVGDVLARVATSAIAAIPFLWLYQYRLFDIPHGSVWTWIALFFGVEFCYYWFHRASHRVRWFWATHAVHHSATRFNLSAAIRLGWTGQLTGAFVFYLPLAWMGFHPIAIALVLVAGLLYQFFLHTSLDVRLGPLEWVLNSPTHHRVHHAANETCLDKNYGSVLIVWDRLFGTFATAPDDETLRYGLKGRSSSYNPIIIALAEWRHLIIDTRAVRGVRAKLKVLFGVP